MRILLACKYLGHDTSGRLNSIRLWCLYKELCDCYSLYSVLAPACPSATLFQSPHLIPASSSISTISDLTFSSTMSVDCKVACIGDGSPFSKVGIARLSRNLTISTWP